MGVDEMDDAYQRILAKIDVLAEMAHRNGRIAVFWRRCTVGLAVGWLSYVLYVNASHPVPIGLN